MNKIYFYLFFVTCFALHMQLKILKNERCRSVIRACRCIVSGSVLTKTRLVSILILFYLQKVR